MKSFQANDLRNLVAEVVSAYKAEKRSWLLESPEVIKVSNGFRIEPFTIEISSFP